MSFFGALLSLMVGGLYLTLFRVPYWEIGSRFYKFITYMCLIGWTLVLLLIEPVQHPHWIQFGLLNVILVINFAHLWTLKTGKHKLRGFIYWVGVIITLWFILALSFWPPGIYSFDYLSPPLLLFIQFTLSALILGSILNAMICGHWYLVNKFLSLEPILSISQTLTAVILAKIGVLSGVLLWIYLNANRMFDMLVFHSPILFWVRIIAGLAFGLLLNWMSWKSLEYDNTQAATGILYGAITFIIMGEFSAFFLTIRTGIAL